MTEADDNTPLPILFERRIRRFLDEMETLPPSECRAMAGAIKGLSESLTSVKGLNDGMQTALLTLMQKLKEEEKDD